MSDTSDVTQVNESVVETIISEVARVEGVEPVDLAEPVFAFVDPDALDSLVASAGAETGFSVRFEAWGHEIGIDGDGTVRIDGEIRNRSAVESVASAERATDR